MAVVINTVFSSFYLSAALPEIVSFSIQDSGAQATVTVVVDGEEVFENTMTAFGNSLKLYDIQSIIEEAIRNNNNAMGSCKVVIEDEYHETDESTLFNVLVSEGVADNPATWLSAHFLTTRSSYRISPNGKQNLHYYKVQTDLTTKFITATVIPAGATVPNVVVWNQGSGGANGLKTELIDMEAIQQHFGTSKVLAFDVERGSRKMTFYVIDEEPTLKMSFLNGFNLPEYIELRGVNVHRRKMEAGTAEVMRKKERYDFNPEETYEVETATLSREEAEWLSQIFTSRYVAVYEGGAYREVIIDGEGEISDSDNVVNRLKFKYEFAKNVKYL